MKQFRILPDALIDWIERQRVPERYYRLVALLLRYANWASGTYSDGVELQKGQVRLTLRKLAKITGYSLDAVHRLVRRLSTAGWVELSTNGNLTIITLTWLAKPEHLEASNPNTQTPKPERQPEHAKQSTTIAIQPYPERQPEHPDAETRTPETAKPEIRSIRSIEVEEDEVKEDKNTHIDAGGIDLEEVGKKLKNLHKRVREEIELRQVTDLTLSEIEEAAGKIRKAFVKSYKKETGNLPAIRAHEYSQLKKLIAHSCPDRESLNEWLKTLLERIEAGNYWRINNSFISKNGRSFYTFVHTIPAIMEGQGRSLTGKGENKVEEAEVKPW